LFTLDSTWISQRVTARTSLQPWCYSGGGGGDGGSSGGFGGS